jgi:hypothetical protein
MRWKRSGRRWSQTLDLLDGCILCSNGKLCFGMIVIVQYMYLSMMEIVSRIIYEGFYWGVGRVLFVSV